MKERVLKPYRKYRIDCGARGIEETMARSPGEAKSRIVYRFRQRGIFPITTYWGEAREVKSEEVIVKK